MLYIRCPTCNRLLGHLQLPFETKLHKIMENDKLSEDEKITAKQELINNELGNIRYCCKTRLLTYIDVVKIVK